MTAYWDEFSAGGDFVEFSAPGDTFAGVIENVGVKVWDDGKKSPQLTIRPDGGGEPQILTASWVMLVSALKREAPNVGDHLRVTLTGIGPKPKETREWKVEVTRGGAGPTPVPASGLPSAPAPAASTSPPPAPASAPPPAVDLAAYRAAGWTDAQLIAAGHMPAPAAPPAPPALPAPPAPPADAPWDADPRVAPLRSAGWSDDQIRQSLGI